MKAKYIVIEYMGTENAIIFPEVLEHANVASNRKVLSAGFVQFTHLDDNDKILAYCFGQSVTLNIKSRGKEDEQLINRYILNDYM